MKIDRATVDRLADLAKLEFDDKEKLKIEEDLTRILDFVDKLKELDTKGVQPLIFMSDDTNVLREDVAKSETTREEALKNAPKKDSDYFKVPKIIDHE